MNRLNELADWIDSIDAIPTNDENLREIATLLRAASAETVGTEWRTSGITLRIGQGCGENILTMANERCPQIVVEQHYADLQAARLAVAAARKERDEASSARQLAMSLYDKAVDKNAALQRELDAALEQKQGHACAMATLAEERDEALATAERHRNDTWQHAEACRTLDAERKSALHRIEQMQEVIDNAAMLWQLSSEGSRTADAMYQALRPMLEPGSWAAGNHSEMPKGSPVPAADLAKIAALQRAIDEAYEWLRRWDTLTARDILRPYATRREGQQANRPQCPTNLTVTQGKVPTREEVMGADPAKVAEFKESLNKASEFVIEWPAWKQRYCQSPPTVADNATVARQWRREYYSDRKFWMSWLCSEGERVTMLQDHPIESYEGFVNLHDDTWCLPHIEGDKREDLPPLPNPDKSPDTMSGSPVPGADPAVTLAFKQSLNEASEIVKDWPAWKRDILKPAVFGPGCYPHPLSTGSTPAAAPLPTELTPATSPCDTRELIARLAEAIGNYFEDGTVMVADLIIRMRDIESAARKGGES